MNGETTTERLDFTSSAGLRMLLRRFADPVDPASWRSPEGEELARFCIRRFEPLAHKHRQPREDAASFAFEVMSDPHLVTADDPWAVVTVAVQRSFVAQATGDALLCGDRAARHAVDVHDPKRISDRDWTFLATHMTTQRPERDSRVPVRTKIGDIPIGWVHRAIQDAARVLQALGWDPREARIAVEYICRRLELADDRSRAHLYLRRDEKILGLLNVDRDLWWDALTVLLGHPDPDRSLTRASYGVLAHLIAGYPVGSVLTELPELIASQRAPRVRRYHDA